MPRHRWSGGRPPEGHPRQCTKVRRNGKRCGKWANRGSDRCESHPRSKSRDQRIGVRTEHLPRFYRDRLTRTLTEVVDSMLGEPAHEQVGLYEELALLRDVAGQVVQLYGTARDARDEHEAALVDVSPDDEQGVAAWQERADALEGALAESAQMMVSQLNQVRDLATAIVRNEAVSKDKLSVHTLHGAMRQVVRIMYEVCGEENQHLAVQLEERVKAEVVLPVAGGTEGTDVTPDQDVLSMDDTVPGTPQEVTP